MAPEATRIRRPRIGFVVQRAGREVVGGAESLCLQIAERMSRHWNTEVLTTCALDYMTWANHYPEGTETIGPVKVRRFPVDRERDVDIFNALSAEIVAKGSAATLTEQEAWMRAQGPMSTRLLDYLSSAAAEYDVFIFFGYLYATTYFGLPIVKEKAFLAPLGHDEWPIYFSMWDHFMMLPRGFIFQTPEELAFLSVRFPKASLRGPVAGIGIEPPEEIKPEAFRDKYRLHSPFLLYVGRVDASKGCDEMFDFFLRSRADSLSHYRLVLIGKEVLPIPFHNDIIYLGFVEESEKWEAMAACDWLLLPSPHESLSIALLETFSVGRPAIVNGRSEVLAGHCRRSNGGLCYESWEECAAFLRMCNDTMMSRMGEQGRNYVEHNYAWRNTESHYLTALRGQLR